MRIVAVDPGAATPFYDHGLCVALAAAGCQIELATAPFIYATLPEPHGYRRSYAFSRFLQTSMDGRWQRTPRLRRLLKAAAYPVDWWRLWRRLAASGERPQLVHLLWSVDPSFDGWWLRRLRRRGVACVYTAHNATAHPGEPTRRRGWRRLYAIPDLIIALSRSVRRELIASYGVDGDRVKVIPMGCDGNHRSEPRRRQARRRLSLPEAGPLALFFGLIKPYKGLDVLIRAFAAVHRRVPAARLVVAGLPKSPFAPLDTLIHEQQLEGSVILDLRYLPIPEAELYLAAADVVVLPYRSASQSGIVTMAYRAGRPVLATDVGGLAEMIEPDRSGILVPPADVAALAEALAELLADLRRTRAMGARARTLARESYAWPPIAATTIEAYRSLLTGAPGDLGSRSPK